MLLRDGVTAQANRGVCTCETFARRGLRWLQSWQSAAKMGEEVAGGGVESELVEGRRGIFLCRGCSGAPPLPTQVLPAVV